MSMQITLLVAFVVVAWVAPVLLLGAGLVRVGPPIQSRRVGLRSFTLSMLLCIIAFNLTFLIQEVFLVLPKALVGLRPTLFHNDHKWAGSAPIAELFEGTGAVAILITGVTSKALADRQKATSAVTLLMLWMGFEGLFQSLPQFVLGAMLPGNDVGRAYAYLHLSVVAQAFIAAAALTAIPLAGLWVGRSFLSIGADHGDWRSRTAFLAQFAAIPALCSVPFIVPFRIPREAVEVVLLPLLVNAMGAAWVLAAAWIPPDPSAIPEPVFRRVWPASFAVLLLLAFFQLVLRHGMRFY